MVMDIDEVRHVILLCEMNLFGLHQVCRQKTRVTSYALLVRVYGSGSSFFSEGGTNHGSSSLRQACCRQPAGAPSTRSSASADAATIRSRRGRSSGECSSARSNSAVAYPRSSNREMTTLAA